MIRRFIITIITNRTKTQQNNTHTHTIKTTQRKKDHNKTSATNTNNK